jgi:hypothetical protein
VDIAKRARPCMMIDLLLFSITFGRTVKTGGKLVSPLGKTLTEVHSVQVVPNVIGTVDTS